MALIKRVIVFVIIGAAVLAAGLAGGTYFGYQHFTSKGPKSDTVQIADPGPMMDMGQFTANLADPETHIVKLRVTLELSGAKVTERLADPGWTIRMKDEIMRALKNQRFDSIRYAEGMEMLKQDLRARLNAILPKIDGKGAISGVLIDEFLVQ